MWTKIGYPLGAVTTRAESDLDQLVDALLPGVLVRRDLLQLGLQKSWWLAPIDVVMDIGEAQLEKRLEVALQRGFPGTIKISRRRVHTYPFVDIIVFGRNQKNHAGRNRMGARKRDRVHGCGFSLGIPDWEGVGANMADQSGAVALRCCCV
jgi:hypothetical protein